MSARWKKRIKYYVLGIMGVLKFSVIFLLLTTYYILHTTTAFAQAPVPYGTGQASTPSPVSSTLPTTNYQLPTTIPPTSPIYTDLLAYNMFHTFSCLAVGSSIIGQPCLTYIHSVPVLSSVNLQGGALGAVTSVIGALYLNPPVRTSDYLASVGQGLGIVKEARAQGVVGSGEGVLHPILTLWQVSRNISYIAMITIFIIIGLMVMFRQRINPQTVITAQAALPGLVIGLILITFSYFFASLISDTAFIGTNLVGYYFVAAQSNTSQEALTQKLKDDNVITIITSLLKGIKKDDIADATGTLFRALGEPKLLDSSDPAFLVRTFAAGAAYQIGSTIGPAIGAGIGGLGCSLFALGTGAIPALLAVPGCAGIGQIVGSIGAGVALAQQTWSNPGGMVGYFLWVLAMIIIIYSMLKLLLRLITSFLTIIFLTITAPFQFLAAALPGRQGIATGWILNMLANVLAFPAVIAVFYFVAFILRPEGLAGSATFPLFGGLNLNFINVLLAFGALVAVPKIPDIISRTVGRAGVAGQLIGEELSGSTRAGRGYLDQSQGASGIVGRDVGRVGELTDKPSIQMVRDTTYPGGWRPIDTRVGGRARETWRRLGF